MYKNYRQLIIVVASFLLTAAAAGGAFLLLSPNLIYQRIEQDYRSECYQQAVDRSYRLMEWFPASEKAREAAYRMMQQLADGTEKIIVGHDFIFRHGTGSSELSFERETLSELYRIIERVADRQRNALWTWNMYERLGEAAVGVGDYEEGEYYLLKALEGFSPKYASSRGAWVGLTLVKLYRALGQDAAAANFALQAERDAGENQMLKAEALAWNATFRAEEGELEEAAVMFRAVQETVRRIIDSSVRDLPDGATASAEDQQAFMIARKGLQYIEALQAEGRGESGFGQVLVSVTRFGTPLEGAEALLRPKEYSGSFSSMIFESGSFPAAVSGQDGVISFPEVEPGDYDLIFRFTPEQLTDAGAFEIPDLVRVEPMAQTDVKIELNARINITGPHSPVIIPYGGTIEAAWEAFPGADRYGVQLVYYSAGGDNPFASSVGTLLDTAAGPEFSLNTGVPGSAKRIGMYSPDQVHPAAVMGFAHPGALFSLSVKAFDHDGRLLTDSDGLIFSREGNYPLWEIAEPADIGLLSPGDRLLLEGNYNAALSAYREAAEQGNVDAALSAEALERSLDFSLPARSPSQLP